MPLDPRIPGMVAPPQPFNGLAQLGQIRAQQQDAQLRQQQINSNQALEQRRRQELAAGQVEADELASYKSIIGNPDLTPDSFLEQVRIKAPGQYDAARTRLEQHAKAALEAKGARQKAAEQTKLWVGGILDDVASSGYDPAIAEVALKTIEAEEPDFAPKAAQIRQQILEGGPTALKALVDGMRTKPKQEAFTLSAGQTRFGPEGQQVATVAKPPDAISPYQQATLAQGAQRIAIDQQRAGREARAAAQQSAAFGTGAGSVGTSAPIAPGTRNEDYLKALPTPTADKVKALVEGRLQLPSRFTKGDTYWQGLLDAAVQYDPSFDAVNYNARSKTRADFTSGKSAQTVNALNTVAQHLNRLSDSAEKLNNTWSPSYNSVTNFLSRHSGSPIVTNFETDKKAVVDELTRTWRQSGGTESDIKSWSSVLDAANSPDQIHGALAEMSELIEGKLKASENQYQQGMGTDKVSVITPEARGVLDKLMGRAKGSAPVAPKAGAKSDPLGIR